MMSSAGKDDIKPEDDSIIFEDDFEKDLLAEDSLADEGMDGLLDDVLNEDEFKGKNKAEEKLLRFAVSEDKESKASQLRLRTQDIDEKQMDIEKPVALNVEDDWKEISEERRANRFLVLFSGLLLFILAIGVVWAVIEMRKAEVVVEHVDDEDVEDREARETITVMQELCRDYMAAKNLEEKLKTVNRPEKVEPMMKDYYSKHEFTPKKVGEVKVVLSSDSDYRIFWIVSCTVEGESEPKSLVVAQNGGNQFGVIWELDVVYQQMSWESFIQKKVVEVTPFRVMALAKAKSGYYGYEFADYSKYRCFRLKVPGSEEYLWGYTEVGGETDDKLVAHYKESSRKIQNEEGFPMILGLRYMKDSLSKKCVLIESFVSNDWKVD